MRAGGSKENPEGERRRFPKLKNPAKIWKNRRQQNHTDNTEVELRQEALEQEVELRQEALEQEVELRQEALEQEVELRQEALEQEVALRQEALEQEVALRQEALEQEVELRQEALEQEVEQLEEVSRRLILREEQLFRQDSPSEEEEEQLFRQDSPSEEEEEQLFRQDSPSEEEEDQLQKDLEALRLQMWMAVHNTFTASSGTLKVLRSAVASIRQQEAQDRRWTGCPQHRVPVWRPQKCLSTHNTLLRHLVEARLKEAAEDDCREPRGLGSPVKRQVCRMGRCVKEDLLTVVRTVQDCYPPQMDILNLYAGLFHQNFSARLTDLAGSGLEPDDCSYLLFWINRCYPQDVLDHEDLQGKIKTACLGSLLLQNQLDHLENQYLTHKEDKVKLWLNAALKKEEESWLSGQKPELIDQFCFSPLALDVIQVMNGCLADFSCVIRDQSKAQRITAHLDSFLRSYQTSVEQFVKGEHGNVGSVVKAHLVCEQQLRDYITSQTGSLSEQQRRRCLDTLSALKDCGYRCLTCPVHIQLKVCLRQLWTPVWLDGSLPVVDSLLDYLNHQLTHLTDLRPACRQSLLCGLHQDLVLQYVKRMMKTRMKNREQQVGGAQRMNEDARKITDFFSEGGCSGSRWLCEVLCSLAEVLRLQDPGSVQLELVSLARRFPDLSDAHVSALLSLKTGLSAADVRSTRRSVEENRLLGAATNERPPFFSRVKVQWINKKIHQLGLKA